VKNLAMIMPEPGGPLQLVERLVPEPGPREAVMRVRATSMNYHDLVNLKGMLKFGPWPRVPMTDGSGEIVAVGAQVRSLAVGDRVNATFTPEWLSGRPTPAARRVVLGDTTDGCLQQYLALDERSFVKVPAHLTDDEAATIPCAGVTAWSSLAAGGIKPGDVVLAEGTGGVSLYTVQLAKAAGARVILTSSSDDKLAVGRSLGADHCVNYRTTPDWAAAVRELTNGRGADIVVDVGGASTLAGSVRAAAMGGTVAIMGVLGGSMSAELPLSTAMQANLHLVGITVGSVADHTDCNRAIEQAGFRPHISHRFAWTQMPEAMATMESQQHVGKIVVTVP